MSLEQTLLAIKREYSKDEKFKLFVRHLDNVENELRLERQKATDLMKINVKQQELIDKLKDELDLFKVVKGTPGFVKAKKHEEMVQKKVEFEKLYFALYWEHKELKEKIENNGNL